MHHVYPHLPGTVKGAEAHTVYIRSVNVAELPEELRAQAEGMEVIYALHRSDGSRLALVANLGLASALALEHDLALVQLH